MKTRSHYVNYVTNKKKENSANEFTWAVDDKCITIQHENKSLRTLVIKENE